LSALIAAASPEEDPDTEPLFMAPLSRRRQLSSSSHVYIGGATADTGSQVYLGTPSLVPDGTYPYAYVPPSSRPQSRLSHDSAESSSSPLFTTRKLSSTTVSSSAGDTPDTSPASGSFEYPKDAPGVAVDEHHPIVVTGTVASQAPPMASRWSLASSVGGTESISTTTTSTTIMSNKKEKKGKRKRFTSFMSKLSVAPPLPNGNVPVMMVPGRWQDLGPGLGTGTGGRSSLSLGGGGGSSSGEFIPPSPSRSRRKPALPAPIPAHVRAEMEREERERETNRELEWEREMEREKERFNGGLAGQGVSSLSLPTQMRAINSPYKTRIRTSSTPLPNLMGSLEDSDEVSVPERTSSSSNDVDGNPTTSASAPVSTNPYSVSLTPVSTPSLPLTHARTHSRTHSQSNGRVHAAHAHAHTNSHFNNAGATVNLDIDTGTSSSPGTESGPWTSNAPILEYERERALPSIPASNHTAELGKSSIDASTRSTSGEYDFPSPPMSPSAITSEPTLDSTRAIPKKQRSLGIRGLAARMMGHGTSRGDTPTPAHNPELYARPAARKKDKGRDKVYDDEMTPFPFYGAPGKKERERPRVMIMKEMKEEKKMVEKRKLVISGIEDGEGGSGEEAVRKWCEAFGEVRAFEKRDKGCLVVDFRKASVADTVSFFCLSGMFGR
jgi:hypothetical protein